MKTSSENSALDWDALPESEKFLRCARELDEAMRSWRFPAGGRTGLIAENSESVEEVRLLKCLDDIGRHFNIVAAGFGVANSQTNLFEIFRHYPGFQQRNKARLFKYQLKYSNHDYRTDLYKELEKFLGGNPLFDYNKWMEDVFLLQRTKQRIDTRSTDEFTVPEFFGQLKAGDAHFIIRSKDISAHIDQWVRLWVKAAMVYPKELQNNQIRQTATAFRLIDCKLLAVISQGFKNLERAVGQEKVKALPCCDFFNLLPDPIKTKEKKSLQESICFVMTEGSVGDLLLTNSLDIGQNSNSAD